MGLRRNPRTPCNVGVSSVPGSWSVGVTLSHGSPWDVVSVLSVDLVSSGSVWVLLFVLSCLVPFEVGVPFLVYP